MKFEKRVLENQKINHINGRNIKTKSEREALEKKNRTKNSYKPNFSFMAMSLGEESVDVEPFQGFKRYFGVAPVSVVAINPNATQLAEIYGTAKKDEPEYLKNVEINGNTTKQMRISLVLATHEDISGVKQYFPLSFTLRKEFTMNKDRTKVKVIDKYSRTAWVTTEQLKAREVPMYSNGPADIDAASYRPMYVGEDLLINFIRALIGIQEVRIFNREANTYIVNPDLSKCICCLDNPEALFTGDISEVKSMINSRPDNKVKVCVGIRTGDDNRKYTDIFREKFLKYRAFPNKDTGIYTQFEREITKIKAEGYRYQDTEFYFGALKEYTVDATTFTANTQEAPTPQISEPEDDLPW